MSLLKNESLNWIILVSYKVTVITLKRTKENIQLCMYEIIYLVKLWSSLI